MMGLGPYNLLSLAVVVGFVLLGAALVIDFTTRRSYGILTLALLVAAVLAYRWMNVIDLEARERA
jgi:uncharacterized membrane protein YphA (DoxX/SURF4 family)